MISPKSDEGLYLSPQLMQEKQWVRRVREEGDKNAFEKIFREYYKRLHGFAYSYVEERAAAEDIVQSVFLKIWTDRKSWDPPGTVKQYLFAAVRNEALNQLRHQKIVTEAQDDVILQFRELKQEKAENLAETEALRLKIEEGIQELPHRCRQIFLLNRRSGLTYTEIADYLGVSINTVNTQMGRALKSLRYSLSDYLPALVSAGISRLFF